MFGHRNKGGNLNGDLFSSSFNSSIAEPEHNGHISTETEESNTIYSQSYVLDLKGPL